TALQSKGAVLEPTDRRVVVTASGKRIEYDLEPGPLDKKFESKKEFLPRKDEFEYAKPPSVPLRQQIEKREAQPQKDYVFPADSLLTAGSFQSSAVSEEEYKETAIKLQQTLQNFGVGVTVTDISCGPAVTRYELHPEQGVKVSKIVSLQDDIKLSLAAADIRIEAPIPGKSAVGIEVPNKENSIVRLRDILSSEEFRRHPSRLAFAVGKDIGGKTVVTDIAKMPHLLIAGATGSGKSVCINTLIMSILYKAAPKDVRLIMIDPKVVELSVYNGIPHLLIPVVTDPKKASAALNWAVAEMTDRYKKFADYNVRDLKGYNAKIESIADIEDDTKPQKLPQIVIIVDELADLMMVAPGEVEDAICRLAQLARAAGIHLVIATQRPSVNVITGLIKANVPSRIAFAVSSGVDSRTIIDMNGAEKLLGKGDMLFYPSGIPKPIRVQGAFVSDNEVTAVVDFLHEQGMTADYSREIEAKMAGGGMDASAADGANERDAYFVQAGKFVIEKDKASIGMLQRVFKIGFNRAARIMDQLAEAGVVGEDEGTKPRKILMSLDEFEELF
ncbi:MAG: DNA translocase FtsK, partial [bacterium]|nr:DNA translocase FtsK [bacterium]